MQAEAEQVQAARAMAQQVAAYWAENYRKTASVRPYGTVIADPLSGRGFPFDPGRHGPEEIARIVRAMMERHGARWAIVSTPAVRREGVLLYNGRTAILDAYHAIAVVVDGLGISERYVVRLNEDGSHEEPVRFLLPPNDAFANLTGLGPHSGGQNG